tara:strand:+ start:402 stop:1055 length:654 start_codon:yes stop_codon:yes gene_type:complete
MSSPFSKQYMGKSPIAALTQQQEAKLPENLKKAIEAKGAGSPVKQSTSPKNAGYYNPEYEAHPSEKLPTRQENKAEIDAAKFGLAQGKQARKDMMKMGSGEDKSAKAKEAYDLSKPAFDADSKMRKQKRKDYSDILEAGKTIAKSSALNQVSMDVSSKKLKKKTAKKELPQATKDSLQQVALKRKKPFYSKKHKVYVEGEDGVLSRTPVNTSGYEKI